MIVVTAQEMQQLDRRTIEEFHIPAGTLMENAGLRVVEEIESAWGFLKGKVVTIAAGKGNNGGDGLVVARLLLERSARVSVFLLTPSDQLTGEAWVNLERFQKISGRIHILKEGTLGELERDLSQSDLIVDALFGTGLSSPVTGLAANVIASINASGKPVVAVDLPSGIHTDTGRVMGIAVKAAMTVSFALPKRGLLLYPGSDYTGRLKIVDIGIPQALIRQLPADLEWITPADVADSLKRRPISAHKGSFGHVLVIAGSGGKSGAAVMASLSALRAGAGLVTLALPSGLEGTLPDRPNEIMTLPLPQTGDRSVGKAALEPLIKFSQGKTVAAIGPGLSTHPETAELVRGLIAQLSIPMVIDADGLNNLVGRLDLLKQARAPIVLTPHPGEMARLIGAAVPEVQSDRFGVAAEFVRRHSVTLVLKGARTIVASKSGTMTINSTGNPGMATAGTGDVLTGMIAGLIAQGHAPEQAARLGVYLHGLAGDLAAAEIGEIGLLAGDLIHRIPAAITKALGPA
ncbi:MAG: NAD(P)H-hydrate dehydratase [Nitrospirae bacterium]|nr:NAD(P)H-hydrate dehydratase [Nitrospirota bacterium]